MNDIERWLRRQAAKEKRGVLLEEGLLGDRLWKYAQHRLRYFFVTYAVETAVHTFTVFFLLRELRWGNFLPILVAHTVGSLGSSLWWGALEALRTQVRDLHRSGRPQRIAQVIGAWLTLSLLLSGAIAALAVAWVTWHLIGSGIGAPEAYVAVLMLRLAVDLPVRCYHSGIYALRRVYKPFVAVVGPQLLELVIIVTLWNLLDIWALVIAAAAVSMTLPAVNLRYTGKIYRFIGLTPRPERTLKAVRRSLRGTAREALQAGAANAVITLDSLVVLAVLYGAARGSDAVVLLFLIAPSIRASAGWARLFYFDLKRLELRLFTNLRGRFERHSARVAWLLGAVFWGFAAAIAAIFVAGTPPVLYLALLVFFLARSMLARIHVQAFAEGSYRPVLATGAALVAGLLLSSLVVTTEAARVTAVALVTAACAGALAYLRRRTTVRGDPGEALLTLEWLRRLGAVSDHVRVGSARVLPASAPERLDARTRDGQIRWRLSQLADRTARRLGDRGAAAWIGPDRVVWFEVASGPPQVPTAWLQSASGGLIAEVVLRECPSGEEALLAAGHEGLLGPASSHLLTAILPVDVAAERRRFADVFPGGIVYSPDQPVPAALAALPASELRAILADAVSFARDLRIGRRKSRSDVTALCAGGELQVIFVVGTHADKRARSKWRHHVTRLNVRAAVGGARELRSVRTGRVGGAARRHLPRFGARARAAGRAVLRRPAPDHHLVDSLRRVPLLSELSPRELAHVAAAMTERDFQAGEQITTEGEPGVGFYVISEGRATVSVNGVEVRELAPGDYFGEIALVAETPRTATVTAATDLHSHRMTSWEFRKLVESSASIAWHVLQSTLKRLHEAAPMELSTTMKPLDGTLSRHLPRKPATGKPDSEKGRAASIPAIVEPSYEVEEARYD